MPAVNYGDRARFLLPAMSRRIERALSLIESAAAAGKIGVSVSSGKDSLVVLDLVRCVIPDVPAAFYDSGGETEYPYNYEFCEMYDVDIITSEVPLAKLCRDYGYWGHDAEVEKDDVDFFAFIVGEPAYRFIEEHDLDITAMGLRAQESSGRRLSRKKNGLFYGTKSVPGRPNYMHLTPIADWSHDDVWAYIAGKNLKYNPAYDLMADAGMPRAHCRVSPLLGASAAHLGRYSSLRRSHPDIFNRLAADFPGLKEFT